jgi:hypothetical protein
LTASRKGTGGFSFSRGDRMILVTVSKFAMLRPGHCQRLVNTIAHRIDVCHSSVRRRLRPFSGNSVSDASDKFGHPRSWASGVSNATQDKVSSQSTCNDLQHAPVSMGQGEVAQSGALLRRSITIQSICWRARTWILDDQGWPQVL